MKGHLQTSQLQLTTAEYKTNTENVCVKKQHTPASNSSRLVNQHRECLCQRAIWYPSLKLFPLSPSHPPTASSPRCSPASAEGCCSGTPFSQPHPPPAHTSPWRTDTQLCPAANSTNACPRRTSSSHGPSHHPPLTQGTPPDHTRGMMTRTAAA